MQADIFYGALQHQGRYNNTLYIGEFSERLYDGCELLFGSPGGAVLNSCMSIRPYDEGTDEFDSYYQAWVTFVKYHGALSSVERTGSGNLCYLDLQLNVSLVRIIPLPEIDNVEYAHHLLGSNNAR